MSKYTPEQLKSMAQDYLAYDAENDLRAKVVMAMLVALTGLSQEECHRKITQLAQGD